MTGTNYVLFIKDHVHNIDEKEVHPRRIQRELQEAAKIFFQQGLIDSDALEAIMGNIRVIKALSI